MALAGRIARNTGFMVVGNIGSKLTVFGLSIFIARYLGAEQLGVFSFAVAFNTLLAVFSHIGLNTLTTRDVARDASEAGRYFANVILIELLLSLATLTLVVVAINLMRYPAHTKGIVYVIGVAVILDSGFTTACKSVFRAFERMEYDALVTIVGKLPLGIGGIILVVLGCGLRELAYLYLISSLVALALGLHLVNKNFVRVRPQPNLVLCRYLIRTAIPFALAGVFNLIYAKTDTIMLSVLKGDTAVGMYTAALSLVLALSLLNNAFLFSIFPSMSNLHGSSKELLGGLCGRALKLSLIFIVPVGIGTVLLADKIIVGIYGAEFAASVIGLQILIWSGAIGFINGLFYAMFGATDRQKTSATVMGAGALANVALNIALIPLYGHTGAAVATVLTQGVCFVVSLHLLADEFHLAIHRAFSRPLVASLCMATVMYGFDRMHLVASIAVGALSYFIVLYRIGGLSESDHEILARLIRRHP